MPDWTDEIRRRLADAKLAPAEEADIAEELAQHLDDRYRELRQRGVDDDEARRTTLDDLATDGTLAALVRAARRTRASESAPLGGARGGGALSGVWSDLRYGVRSLRRAPGFACIAVLTLALGIGATAAIFSVVNTVVLRPLPYPGADRIVMVWMDNRRQGNHEDWHSSPNFTDLRNQNEVLSGLAAFQTTGLNLTGTSGEPERVDAVIATADLFTVLQTRPLLGQLYTAEQEVQGRNHVVLLSYGLWTRAFGSEPGIVGTTIHLNGTPYTVLGVMPPGFGFPTAETDLWTPLVVPPDLAANRRAYWLRAVGRIEPGVSFAAAQTAMTTIARRLEQQYPGNRDLGVNLVPLPRQVVGPTLRTALWVMLAAVGAVLLIACANVANLLLARATTREREMGVRIALGASRWRIVRQLLAEGVLLAAAGCAAGLALAWAGLRVLRSVAPAELPRIGQVGLDPVVLGFALAVSVLTVVVFGLVPALQTSRPGLDQALRQGGRSGTAARSGLRLRRALVAAQLALVVVLLTGAGLLLRSFVALQQVELGFRTDHLLTARVQLPRGAYGEPAQRVAFYNAVLERIRSLPGVTDAAGATSIFLSNTPASTNVAIEGMAPSQDQEFSEVTYDAITPGYLRTIGARLVTGRALTERDRAGTQPVSLINEHMAKHFWPGENPIGRRFNFGGANVDTTQSPWVTVVGVMADMRRTGLDNPVRDETFQPLAQSAPFGLSLVVHTRGDPLALAPALRRAVHAIDPEQPVYDIQSMEQQLGGMVAQRRFSMELLAAFASLALVLALVGVYGVTSYLVAQRTREIGVRLALGAEPGAVVRMVVRQGMGVALAGGAAGLVAALFATRVMASLLYGVSTTDGLTFAGAAVLLALAALAANYLPARRAAHVDPLMALRSE